jgi:hypothetical protein
MGSDASNMFLGLRWSLEGDRGGDGGAPTNAHLATKKFIPFRHASGASKLQVNWPWFPGKPIYNSQCPVIST